MEIKEFNDILSNNRVVVAKFGAQWCSPCKTMEPILESVAEKLEGKVKVVDIDVDDSPELSTQYRVKNIPTIIYFKDGNAQDKTIGAMSESSLEEHINNIL